MTLDNMYNKAYPTFPQEIMENPLTQSTKGAKYLKQ